MKSIIRNIAVGIISLALVSTAVFAQPFFGSDNFDDNSFESGRWQSFGTANGGAWTEVNGRMEFTGNASDTSTISTTNRVQQFRLWSNNTPNISYTTDWVAAANFTIDPAAVATNGVVLMGLETFATATDAGYYGIYLMSATGGGRIFTERGVWNGSGYDRQTVGTFSPLVPDFDVTDVRLEIRYDAATQILSSAFSYDNGATYFNYVTGGGTGYSGAAAPYNVNNWSASATDGFGLDIYGATYGNTSTPTGPTVLSGQAYMDNLTVSAVPEPSTYAAIAGALMLGFAAWRRRQQQRA
jgi:hypothetical protein